MKEIMIRFGLDTPLQITDEDMKPSKSVEVQFWQLAIKTYLSVISKLKGVADKNFMELMHRELTLSLLDFCQKKGLRGLTIVICDINNLKTSLARGDLVATIMVDITRDERLRFTLAQYLASFVNQKELTRLIDRARANRAKQKAKV
jgi:hypothetical protein